MHLTAEEVQRFYAIWFPLLRYVNANKKVVPDSLLLKDSWNGNDAALIRDALWDDSKLLETFAQENPARLSERDLSVARSWRWHVKDTFFVIKHLKKHSIFVASNSGKSKVYTVLGLSGPLEDTLFETVCMVKAVLIPFEGKITYDSLLVCHSISFGGNITRTLNSDYQAAKRSGQIITSLERAPLALAR